MHASHVAILVLAASTASPALSAPLAARGTAGVPAISDVVARAVPPAIGALDDFLAQHGKPNPGRRPGGIRARDLEDAFLQGIARRDHDVSDSDPHGARASPFATLDDFLVPSTASRGRVLAVSPPVSRPATFPDAMFPNSSLVSVSAPFSRRSKLSSGPKKSLAGVSP